ncbi:MAG: hypothetical protein LUG96_00920 [Tannerellaceae bacterium]|nr:hypothetical protein [Tannerellaceae bacterium]
MGHWVSSVFFYTLQIHIPSRSPAKKGYTRFPKRVHRFYKKGAPVFGVYVWVYTEELFDT